MSIKDIVLDLLRQDGEAEQEFLAGLSQAERDAAGTYENWAPKDMLAHIAEWRERMVQNLDITAQGKPRITVDDLDATNASIYEQHHNQSWDEVVARARAAHRELTARVEALTDAGLRNEARIRWPEDQPLWRPIMGNSFIHTLDHISRYYLQTGQTEKADELQDRIVNQLNRLEDTPEWHGNNTYNLACYFALSRRKERAIDLLREALRLNPKLTEWSQEDPDFASLHGDPAYENLYQA